MNYSPTPLVDEAAAQMSEGTAAVFREQVDTANADAVEPSEREELRDTFAEYLPESVQEEARERVHHVLATSSNAVPQDEVLYTVVYSVAVAQSPSSAAEAPVSKAVLKASAEKLEPGRKVMCETKQAVDRVVDAFFVDVGERLERRDDVQNALLN